MLIKAISGDIARIQADAVVSFISSPGTCSSVADRAIRRVSGWQYYETLDNIRGSVKLFDGQVEIVKRRVTHTGGFRDVVFVVDNIKRPLGKIVQITLEAVQAAGYSKVSLPAMRTGIMSGIFEKDNQEVVSEIISGIVSYSIKNPESKLEIFIVVYEDETYFKMIESALEAIQ